MKQIFISDDGVAGFDPEVNEMFRVNRQPDRINNLLVIEGPTKVIVRNYDGNQYTLDAEKGDLVITFYTNDYEKRAVLVKSEDWYNNIIKLAELEAKRKQGWAAERVEKPVGNATACEGDKCEGGC